MLTQQQRNQIFNVSIKELANPNATVPVKFDPFERFVRKAQNYSKNLYFLMLTSVFIWSVLFVSIKGFILFVVMLRSVGFCFSHADFSIRKAAKWYWYIVTKNHMKVHDKYCVPFSKDEYSCYCSVSEKNSISLFISEDEEYVSSIPSKDTYPSLDSVLDDSSRCYCSMCLEEDNAGATNENRSGVLGEKDTDGFATKKGDVIVVNYNKNIRVPNYRDYELIGDQVGDDTGLTGGEVHVDETNLYDQNSKVDGNITSDILNDEVLSSSHVENIVENTPRDVLQPLVNIEIVSSSSETSFSNKNVSNQDSTRLRSISKVRRFVRSCQGGALKCMRPRPLRRLNKFYFRFSSTSVEYIGLERFDSMKGSSSFVEQGMEVEIQSCEPMEVDSYENDSCEPVFFFEADSFDVNSVKADTFVVDEQLEVADEGSFCVGLPTLEEGSINEPVNFDNLLSNIFIPESQPCDHTFLVGAPIISDPIFNDETVDYDAALLFEHLLEPAVNPAFVQEPALMAVGDSGNVDELFVEKSQEVSDTTLVCEEPMELESKESAATLQVESAASSQEEPDASLAGLEDFDEEAFASILSSALANTMAMPLSEGVFNSEELIDQLFTASGSNLEDPFDSRPIDSQAGSSSEPAVVKDEEKIKSSKLDALFEESEEEEEEEEKPIAVLFKSRYKKDDRKIIKPKSLINRTT